MPVWADATIQRFQTQGEYNFLVENPNTIIDRIALSIVAGTSEYTLDESVISIRKITWKGTKIEPLDHRHYREIGLTNYQGVPKEYIFNNVGKQVIKFFPTPNETIASAASNLFGTEIANRVIVEFCRFSGGNNYRIPNFIRRRLLKDYALSMCFGIESKGYNAKAAKYFDQKWQLHKEEYSILLNELVNTPRMLISGDPANSNFNQIKTARLNPSVYGIGVDY